MMSTMGTHSSGQPSRKISARISIMISSGDMSSPSSTSVSIFGVPRFENTAPKKFDAATRNMISTVISRLLISAS
jgi:hypothetical protein